ncbi:MAG: putative transport system permease protein [Acidobacteriota bacterium]|nr:putative transport system permease protein [Acidobacteriota bacterium]
MNRYWFELKEGVLFSLKAIKANKARSMLTTLGIVIGICSVALMATAIKGIDRAFEQGISALGADNLWIDKWPWFTDEEWWKIRNRRNLTMENYEKYKSLAKKPLAVAPTLWSSCKVQYNGHYIEDTLVTGSTADYVKTTNFDFAQGRFYSEIEADGARDVAVVGNDIVENLFKHINPLDQYIEVDRIKFKIVGVLKKQGSNLLGDFNPDKQVYIPIGASIKYYTGHRRSIAIVVRAKSTAQVKETAEEAEEMMRRARGLKYNQENDFSINQQEGLMRNYNQTVGVIKLVGLFITGLSLLVGAIGIMNIMFVSVKERTREIGIRKAIGAKKRTILSQFLAEAALICLIGGMIGLTLAIVLSMGINKFLPTSVQMDTVFLAITISILTGIISGFVPAYTAAKMDPVDALRYE